jgi:tryptophanyl-tRNA synthetase
LPYVALVFFELLRRADTLIPFIASITRLLCPIMFPDRVLSGMRPTGRLHLGHYHGALKNWVKLQNEHPCFFFVADWHALTTHYESPDVIQQYTYDTVIDWIAAGIDPSQATMFVQSRVPQHAELTLLMSFFTPLSWLERVPTYKDQVEKQGQYGRDLTTYGFLGYPLMQAADILIYRANQVPVGEDQVSHIELTREVARRFNHLFGREKGFEEKAEAAVKKLGSKKAKLYSGLRTQYQQEGNQQALDQARELLSDVQYLSMGDRERLFGYLEGGGKVILPEPEALLTPVSRMVGLDGQKMSKSYGNTIDIRDTEKAVTDKVRKMPTDPARVRRTDAGNPEKCPVWELHQVYSNDDTKRWVVEGCQSAGIGCLECKQPVIDAICTELKPMRARAAAFEDDPMLIKNIIADGCEKARDIAEETMRDVRDAMGLDYK